MNISFLIARCNEDTGQTSSINYLCLWLGPLPYGSVCQLGLCERCLPDAEVWRHQVEGGAGASWYPLYSLQRAAQCVHINHTFPSFLPFKCIGDYLRAIQPSNLLKKKMKVLLINDMEGDLWITWIQFFVV